MQCLVAHESWALLGYFAMTFCDAQSFGRFCECVNVQPKGRVQYVSASSDRVLIPDLCLTMGECATIDTSSSDGVDG